MGLPIKFFKPAARICDPEANHIKVSVWDKTSTKSSIETDSFQREIIKNCFDTIADDMAITLMRTAYSGIVRDSLDFSTAICDPDGLTLAQGVCTPMHMGSFFGTPCTEKAHFEDPWPYICFI